MNAENSLQFLQTFSELAQDLATREIAVTYLQLDYLTFGNWVLELRKHGEALRFTWDGRDALLTIETAQVRGSHVVYRWTDEKQVQLNAAKGEVPTQFVSDYLLTRLG